MRGVFLTIEEEWAVRRWQINIKGASTDDDQDANRILHKYLD
jgi:hypothetical protein